VKLWIAGVRGYIVKSDSDRDLHHRCGDSIKATNLFLLLNATEAMLSNFQCGGPAVAVPELASKRLTSREA